MSLFAPLPDDLGALSDDDLATIEAEHIAVIERLHAGDAELIGDLAASEVIAEMTLGVEQVEAVRAERSARETAQAEAAAAVAELAVRAGIAEPVVAEVEDEDGDAEPEPEPEPEAVVAAAPQPSYVGRRVGLARRPANRPSDAPRSPVSITAAADIPGVALGQELASVDDIARAMIARHRNIGRPAGDVFEKVPVATIRREYDDAATLRDDAQANWAKIQSVVSPKALAASGGLCAPVTPYYEQMNITTAIRPVRDSLPRFNADRGGIAFNPPQSLADLSGSAAVGHVTAANDKIGGTSAAKTCLHVTCEEAHEVDVDILFRCIQFGNLGARAWPEQVANFTALAIAAQSQLAEVFILDGIANGSTAVTGAAVGGAANTLLGQILTAAAGMRSRQRMAPDSSFRVMLPDWTKDLLVVDLMRSQFQRFDMNQAGVEALLRSFGISLTFYIDGPTAGAQVFGAQAAGALLGFPTTCVWFIFPEGSFIWLDGGTLDLGVVRDSTLNSTNDYSVFAETFENVAMVGVESLKVTSQVCANGEVTLPKTQSCPVV